MTARQVQRPIFVVDCDDSTCLAFFTPEDWYERGSDFRARRAAEKAGWQVRPARGDGARTAPDFCPVHRTDGGDPR